MDITKQIIDQRIIGIIKENPSLFTESEDKNISKAFLLLGVSSHINVASCVVKIVYLLLPKNTVFALVNFIISTVVTFFLICAFAFVLDRKNHRVYILLGGDRKR